MLYEVITVAFPGGEGNSLGMGIHKLVSDVDLSLIGILQTGEAPEEGGLSAARGAQKRQEGTCRITSYNVCYTKLLRFPASVFPPFSPTLRSCFPVFNYSTSERANGWDFSADF